MTIRHANGQMIEAILLSRAGNTIRVILNGAEDVAEFTDVNGTWVSGDCEPVWVETAWQRRSSNEALSEAACVCSPQLASHLIHLLLNPDEEGAPNMSNLPKEPRHSVTTLV
jgi:hypothetical protein